MATRRQFGVGSIIEQVTSFRGDLNGFIIGSTVVPGFSRESCQQLEMLGNRQWLAHWSLTLHNDRSYSREEKTGEGENNV